LDQLGVDEHDAEVEVMQEPQRGLLRRLRAEAKVRARVRPTVPPPKIDRRDRRRRDREGRDGARPRSRGKAGAGDGRPASSGQKQGAGRDKDTAAADGRKRGDATEADQSTAPGSVRVAANSEPSDEAGSQQATRSDGSRRRRQRSRRGGGKAEGARQVSDSTATDTDQPDLDIEAQRATVEEFLRGLMVAFDRDDASVTAVVDDGTIDAAVAGPELGLLVGQKGATLQALHELVRSVVQRQFVGQSHARVRVDVAGYRARRREALERFAIEVAESVRASGVAKALDPMGPADRKVVHDAVNPLEGVETISEGEDDARHVVIRPSS
jgi:spoIIIJ-associated protein